MRERYSIEQRYAEFYKLYVGDFKQDIPIYLELAGKYPGPILEVGCGTGRVAAYLAAAGHQVLGVDISRPMLEVARQHLQPWSDRVRILGHDLRHSPLPERYGVVLVTLHTFNCLIDIEEQRLFLRHLRQTLSEPGVLVMDCFCPLALVQPEIADQWRQIKRSYGDQCVQVCDRREMLTPLLERRTQVFRLNNGPELEMVTHRRFVPPSLAAHLLEEAGFEGVLCIEGYDMSSARPASEAEGVTGPFLLLAEA